MPRPPHPPPSDCPTSIFLMKITNHEAHIMQFSPAFVTSSFLGTDTLVSTVFLNAVGLFSSLSVRDQVAQPCKRKSKGSVLYMYSLFLCMAQQSLVGQGLFIVDTLLDAPHSVGLLCVIRPTRRRDLYVTTHNTHKRQTSMPPSGIRTRNPTGCLSLYLETHAWDLDLGLCDV
jgi:hypothetical protein